MSKNIKISIPKPCHEDRNKMLPTSNGYFCNSCEKEVIDFRNFSDADIQLFFKKMEGKSTCGIFNTEQLFFPDIEAKSYTFNKYFTRFGFGAMAILSSLLAQAQVTKPKKVETFISPKIDKKIAITFPLIITGKVVSDENILEMGILKGEPVIGATIIINNSIKVFVVNDIDGNFGIQINENDFINGSLILSIQFLGFEKELITINKNNLTNLYFEIKLKAERITNIESFKLGFEIKKNDTSCGGYQTIQNEQLVSISGSVLSAMDDKSSGLKRGQAIIGATVVFVGSAKGTVTNDSTGNFKFILTSQEYLKYGNKLSISFLGFKTKFIEANIYLPNMIHLESDYVEIIGLTVIGGTYSVNKTIKETKYKKKIINSAKIKETAKVLKPKTNFFKRIFSISDTLKLVSDSIIKVKALCLPKKKITTTFPLKISGTITFADNDAALGVKKGEGAISADIAIENANLKFKITDIDGNFDLILYPEYFINDECKITISYLNTVFDTVILNQTKNIKSYYNIIINSKIHQNSEIHHKNLITSKNVTVDGKTMGKTINLQSDSLNTSNISKLINISQPSNERNYVSFEHPKPIETLKITGKIKDIIDLLASKSINPDSVKSILLVRANEYFQVVEIDKKGEFCLDYPQSKSAIEPISISFYSKILPSKEFVITKDELLKNNILKIK